MYRLSGLATQIVEFLADGTTVLFDLFTYNVLFALCISFLLSVGLAFGACR